MHHILGDIKLAIVPKDLLRYSIDTFLQAMIHVIAKCCNVENWVGAKETISVEWIKLAII